MLRVKEELVQGRRAFRAAPTGTGKEDEPPPPEGGDGSGTGLQGGGRRLRTLGTPSDPQRLSRPLGAHLRSFSGEFVRRSRRAFGPARVVARIDDADGARPRVVALPGGRVLVVFLDRTLSAHGRSAQTRLKTLVLDARRSVTIRDLGVVGAFAAVGRVFDGALLTYVAGTPRCRRSVCAPRALRATLLDASGPRAGPTVTVNADSSNPTDSDARLARGGVLGAPGPRVGCPADRDDPGVLDAPLRARRSTRLSRLRRARHGERRSRDPPRRWVARCRCGSHGDGRGVRRQGGAPHRRPRRGLAGSVHPER